MCIPARRKTRQAKAASAAKAQAASKGPQTFADILDAVRTFHARPALRQSCCCLVLGRSRWIST